MPKLGVNIDHVATLRQARGEKEPDPIFAAYICELAGADSIVVHLREDRRHINERDLRLLREKVKTRLNLEMSVEGEIVDIALDVLPNQSTLVPEKRQELTTEGGLDVILNADLIKDVVSRLKNKGIAVSIFIDPDKEQIEKAKELNADFIELHTGSYSHSKNEEEFKERLNELAEATQLALKIGLRVNAGHGLNYQNVCPIAQIKGIEELNIGHSIISRSVFVGLKQAVVEMKELIG
ncbi:MAG: pyridoxine 5'-phosphate synthase [Candidatus Omnitrophota bacterium]|nr:pyridoxine 5'-phosphate synthase [Candidatus Omnitrophota bacterium]